MNEKITDILQSQLESPSGVATIEPPKHNENESALQTEYKRPEHLWRPGESGNPSGRPKDSVSLVTTLKQQLREHPELATDIIQALITKGKSQDVSAIKEMFDRIDGKVVETHRIEGEIPVVLKFMPARELLTEGDGSIYTKEGQ